MSDYYQQLQDICPIHTENVRLSKAGTGQMSDHEFLLGKTLNRKSGMRLILYENLYKNLVVFLERWACTWYLCPDGLVTFRHILTPFCLSQSQAS